MSNTTDKEIEKYLLKKIQQHPHDIVRRAMEHFSVTRTTILRHLRYLIQSGAVIKTGQRKQTAYVLAESMKKKWVFPLDKPFDEMRIWSEYCEPAILKSTNSLAKMIFEYVGTELLNNAKDHSLGTRVIVECSQDAKYIDMFIKDNGIGIFHNIEQAMGFDDIRDAIFELSKGKLTTDPAHHTGEGIFFSSRGVDLFEIYANNYLYQCDNVENDWIFLQTKTAKGTAIHLRLQRNTQRNLVDVFKKYQKDDEFDFVKTDIHLSLAQQFSDRLISRSQAKRVIRSLEAFEVITLDFKGVHAVGQGFVDEIFRVYQSKRPDIKLIYINAEKDVEYMLQRGIAIAVRHRASQKH